MKKFVSLLFLTLLLGLTQSVFAQGTRVQVRGGQERSAAGGKVRIKAVAVEDERCPADFRCRTSGNAKVTAEISVRGGESKTVEFNTQLRGDEGAVQAGDYRIELKALTPVPRSKQKLRTRDYTATFSVVRAK